MPTPISDSTADDVVVVRHADTDTTMSMSSRDTYWPVNWTSIWVGALSALVTALIFGLTAIAVGAHKLGPGGGGPTTTTLGLAGLIFSVFGGFISFVVGGWVAGKINGYRRAETDMLHGAIVWLIAVPILLGLAAIGAGGFFGTWFGGLAGTPVFVSPTGNVGADPNAAAAARNAALGALTALLLGLVGSVIGGWMASGEPMTFTHYRTRTRTVHERDRMAAPHHA
jgi:hypothetical protein